MSMQEDTGKKCHKKQQFLSKKSFSQPGCYRQTEMTPGSCNHDRAPQYYAESINTEIGFWGYPCRKKFCNIINEKIA